MPENALIIRPLPAFADNYVWWLARGPHALVVDPGDAEPVQRALAASPGTRLSAILVTHHHPDHTGGVAELAAQVAAATGDPLAIYAPAAEAIRGCTHPVGDGDTIDLLGLRFEVIGVPGHTRGHVAYHAPHARLLFCGDTLFAGGCGRIFEGTPAQLHASLQRLAALPAATRVCCAHEYTVSNLRFAAAVEPGNPIVAERLARCRAARERGEATLPGTVGDEHDTNPFLRVGQPAVRAAAALRLGRADPPELDELAVFTAIRKWKDVFVPVIAPE